MKKLLVIMSIMAMMLTMASCGGTEIVEEKPVETAYVDTVYAANDGDYELAHKEIIDVMEESDAQFFYIDADDGISPYEIYQTDMATFDEKAETVPKSDKATKTITAGLNHFINLSYNEFPDDPNTWFKNLMPFSDDILEFKDYFVDNSIDLTCEKVNPLKMGIMFYNTSDTDPEGNPCTPQNSYYYFFVGTADVTTVEKASDPNGYFPEVGETETITIKAFFYNNDVNKMFGLEGLYFE